MAGIAMLLLCSCDAENTISTQYLCQFIFRTQYHLDCSIVTALSGAGTYTMVSAKRVNGVWNIYSTLNDGRNHTETIILSTAKENYANYSHMGAGSNTTDATKTALSWEQPTSTVTLPGTVNALTASSNMAGPTIRWNGQETANQLFATNAKEFITWKTAR